MCRYIQVGFRASASINSISAAHTSAEGGKVVPKTLERLLFLFQSNRRPPPCAVSED